MSNFPVYMIYLWTFINIGRPQDIFPALKAFNPGDVAAILSIVSYFLSGTKRQPLFSFKEFRLFIGLFIVAVMCIPFGFYPRAGVMFLYGFFIKFGIYLYLVINLMTTDERTEGMIKTIIFSGIIMAVFVVLRIQVGARIGGGSTYDPNDVALLFVTTLPISYMLGKAPVSRFWKVFCYSGCIFCVIGLIATQSRGGFLGLLAVAFYVLFHKSTVFPKKRIIGFMAVLGVVFLIIAGVEYKERLQTIFSDVSGVQAGSGRIAVWKRSLVMFRDQPLLGVGPHAFPTAMGEYLESNRFTGDIGREAFGAAWKTAHNSYLLILVELGIPGLIIFCMINLLTFRNLRQLQAYAAESKIKQNVGVISTGLEFGLFGLLVCAFFLSQSYNGLIYLLCFMSGAMLRIAELKEETLRQSSPEEHLATRISTGL